MLRSLDDLLSDHPCRQSYPTGPECGSKNLAPMVRRVRFDFHPIVQDKDWPQERPPPHTNSEDTGDRPKGMCACAACEKPGSTSKGWN
ncbi:hypothetical protein TRIP_B200187 [uncultured Desulfatiglans sp.]|nr:hypothetical protein TRIP_B200187 [uncultured Desulfatiglans sp.]